MTQWLIHVDSDEDQFNRAKGALGLASAYGGQACAFVVASAPMMPYGPGREVLKREVAAATQAVLGDAERLRVEFENATGVDCKVLKTCADRELVDAASLMRGADLVVCPQPMHGPNGLSETLQEAALFASGRPLLVLPKTYSPAGLTGKVTVAWKDAREAARAMFDAIALLKRAQSVSLVSVEEEDGRPPVVPHSQARAEAALRRHEVAVSDSRCLAKGGSVAATLADAAVGSDFLVLGGYGRWRWTERVFGGVTQTMLQDPPLPIFMAH